MSWNSPFSLFSVVPVQIGTEAVAAEETAAAPMSEDVPSPEVPALTEPAPQEEAAAEMPTPADPVRLSELRETAPVSGTTRPAADLPSVPSPVVTPPAETPPVSAPESQPADLAVPPQKDGDPADVPAVRDDLPAPEEPAIPETAPQPILPKILFAASILWLGGVGAMIVYAAASYLSVRRAMATAIRLGEGVYQSDVIRSPFLLGVVRPTIYLPTGVDGDMLRYVLAHERYHIRRGDSAVKLFAFLLLALHWFNPLVWLAFALMTRDMEMSCDEYVLSTEPDIQKSYSYSLLSFASGKRFPSPSPLSFGEGDVKSRIKNVLGWHRPKRWVTVLAILLAVTAAVFCMANPAEKKTPAEAASEDDLFDPAGLEPPLPEDFENSLAVPVPDFLNAEQRDLFLRAEAIFPAFAGAPEILARYSPDEEPETPDAWPEEDGYFPLGGRYAKYADFEAMARSIFTDEYFDYLNTGSLAKPLFLDVDGWTYYLGVGIGGPEVNVAYELIESTSDRLLFRQINRIGNSRPEEDVTAYDVYAAEIEMRRGEDGWRVNAFVTQDGHAIRLDGIESEYLGTESVYPEPPASDPFAPRFVSAELKPSAVHESLAEAEAAHPTCTFPLWAINNTSPDGFSEEVDRWRAQLDSPLVSDSHFLLAIEDIPDLKLSVYNPAAADSVYWRGECYFIPRSFRLRSADFHILRLDFGVLIWNGPIGSSGSWEAEEEEQRFALFTDRGVWWIKNSPSVTGETLTFDTFDETELSFQRFSNAVLNAEKNAADAVLLAADDPDGFWSDNGTVRFDEDGAPLFGTQAEFPRTVADWVHARSVQFENGFGETGPLWYTADLIRQIDEEANEITARLAEITVSLENVSAEAEKNSLLAERAALSDRMDLVKRAKELAADKQNGLLADWIAETARTSTRPEIEGKIKKLEGQRIQASNDMNNAIVRVAELSESIDRRKALIEDGSAPSEDRISAASELSAFERERDQQTALEERCLNAIRQFGMYISWYEAVLEEMEKNGLGELSDEAVRGLYADMIEARYTYESYQPYGAELGDLDGDGVMELIVYRQPTESTYPLDIYTIEDGEVRAFFSPFDVPRSAGAPDYDVILSSLPASFAVPDSLIGFFRMESGIAILGAYVGSEFNASYRCYQFASIDGTLRIRELFSAEWMGEWYYDEAMRNRTFMNGEEIAGGYEAFRTAWDSWVSDFALAYGTVTPCASDEWFITAPGDSYPSPSLVQWLRGVLPGDKLSVRLRGLTAEDLLYITGTFSHVTAEELAPVLNQTGTRKSEPAPGSFRNYYELEIYLSYASPDGGFGSESETLHLFAGLQEDLVRITWTDDGNRQYTERFVSDPDLYRILRENYRLTENIDTYALLKWGRAVKERAAETVENTLGMDGIPVFTNYRILAFSQKDTFEDSGIRYTVYEWSPVFLTNDPDNVVWAGGMYLDADERVCALEQETYWAIQETESEARGLFFDWSLYLGPDEESGILQARETVVQAFATKEGIPVEESPEERAETDALHAKGLFSRLETALVAEQLVTLTMKPEWLTDGDLRSAAGIFKLFGISGTRYGNDYPAVFLDMIHKSDSGYAIYPSDLKRLAVEFAGEPEAEFRIDDYLDNVTGYDPVNAVVYVVPTELPSPRYEAENLTVEVRENGTSARFTLYKTEYTMGYPRELLEKTCLGDWEITFTAQGEGMLPRMWFGPAEATAPTAEEADTLGMNLSRFLQITEFDSASVPFDETIADETGSYFRVTGADFSSWDGWQAFVRSIFTEEAAERILNDPDAVMKEVGGAAFIRPGAGGGFDPNRYTSIIRPDEGRYVIDIRYAAPSFLDESGEITLTFPLRFENGAWRIDASVSDASRDNLTADGSGTAFSFRFLEPGDLPANVYETIMDFSEYTAAQSSFTINDLAARLLDEAGGRPILLSFSRPDGLAFLLGEIAEGVYTSFGVSGVMYEGAFYPLPAGLPFRDGWFAFDITASGDIRLGTWPPSGNAETTQGFVILHDGRAAWTENDPAVTGETLYIRVDDGLNIREDDGLYYHRVNNRSYSLWQDHSSIFQISGLKNGDLFTETGIIGYAADGLPRLVTQTTETFNDFFETQYVKPVLPDGVPYSGFQYVDKRGEMTLEEWEAYLAACHSADGAEPPLFPQTAAMEVPDFLDAEQADLFRRAEQVNAAFCGVSDVIDYVLPPSPDGLISFDDGDDAPLMREGNRYVPLHGRYADWETFQKLGRSLYTEDFWAALSKPYLSSGGRTYVLDSGRGDLPATNAYELIESTSDCLLFRRIVKQFIGPRDEEPTVFTCYGYLIEMVKTADGWRLNMFADGVGRAIGQKGVYLYTETISADGSGTVKILPYSPVFHGPTDINGLGGTYAPFTIDLPESWHELVTVDVRDGEFPMINFFTGTGTQEDPWEYLFTWLVTPNNISWDGTKLKGMRFSDNICTFADESGRRYNMQFATMSGDQTDWISAEGDAQTVIAEYGAVLASLRPNEGYTIVNAQPGSGVCGQWDAYTEIAESFVPAAVRETVNLPLTVTSDQGTVSVPAVSLTVPKSPIWAEDVEVKTQLETDDSGATVFTCRFAESDFLFFTIRVEVVPWQAAAGPIRLPEHVRLLRTGEVEADGQYIHYRITASYFDNELRRTISAPFRFRAFENLPEDVRIQLTLEAEAIFASLGPAKPEPSASRGAIPGNLVHFGHIAQDTQGRIYFEDPEDRNLWRVNADGSDPVLLTTDRALYINVLNGWVTYVDDWRTIRRVSADGGDPVTLWDAPTDSLIAPHISCLFVTPDAIWFGARIDGIDRVYRMNADGSGVEMILSGYTLEGVDGGKLFVSEHTGPQSSGLYQTDIAALNGEFPVLEQIWEGSLYSAVVDEYGIAILVSALERIVVLDRETFAEIYSTRYTYVDFLWAYGKLSLYGYTGEHGDQWVIRQIDVETGVTSDILTFGDEIFDQEGRTYGITCYDYYRSPDSEAVRQAFAAAHLELADRNGQIWMLDSMPMELQFVNGEVWCLGRSAKLLRETGLSLGWIVCDGAGGTVAPFFQKN